MFESFQHDDKRDPRSLPPDVMFEKLFANIIPRATEEDRTEQCADNAFLDRFLTTQKPSLFDAETQHVLGCNYCMWRLALKRQALAEKHKRLKNKRLPFAFAGIVAACLALYGSSLLVRHELQKNAIHPANLGSADSKPPYVTVDLMSAGVQGGNEQKSSSVAEVLLPASRVYLSLILPRFSDTGLYTVRVLKNRAGQAVVSQGSGQARSLGSRVVLAVLLDLQNAAPGMYYLETIQMADHAVSYYSLRVQGQRPH